MLRCMANTELTIELDPETAEGVAEAAKLGEVSVSEWIGAAAQTALAAERDLTGEDDLHDLLEVDLAEIPAEVEAEFGDASLATP